MTEHKGYITNWDKYINATPHIVTVPTYNFNLYHNLLDDQHIGWEAIEWPKLDERWLITYFYKPSRYEKSTLATHLKDFIPATFYGTRLNPLMLDTLLYKPTLMIASFYRIDKHIPKWWGFNKDRESTIDSLMESFTKSNHLDEYSLQYIEYNEMRKRHTYGIRDNRKKDFPSFGGLLRRTFGQQLPSNRSYYWGRSW